jgi:type I restriction enzyme S subunit
MEVRPGYKLTEVGEIPEDWEVREIRAVCKLINGRGFRPFEWKTSGLPIIRIQNLNGSDEFNYFDGAYDPKLEVDKGQLLFAWSGSRGTSFGPHLWSGSLGLLNYHTWKVQINKKEIHGKFFYYALKKLTEFIEGRAHGASALVHTQKWEMEGFEFPAPADQVEQSAIAAALGDIDSLLGGLERLIAKKRDLKQAAMQQLLTGETRLPGFSGEWEVKQLGDVVDTDPENLGSDTRPDFSFNYIALEDVDQGLLKSHSEQIFALAPSRARRRLRANDVLVSTVRPNLQSHLHFVESTGTWVCSTGFCVVRCHAGAMHPSYVFSHLLASYLNRQIDTLLTGSNYPAINSGDVRALQIPVPEYGEQTAIATVLSDMDAELSALEARRDKTRALKQAMMQELLTGKTRIA